MNLTTRFLLLEAWQYCDDEDKSTEFMLQYMQDHANVDFDCVMAFIQRTTEKEREEFCKIYNNSQTER